MRVTTKSLLAACAAVTLAACGTTSENTGAIEKQNPLSHCHGKNGEYTIGMSQANVAEPYRVRMNEDISIAAAKVRESTGVKQFDIQFQDAAQDNSKQVSQVESFLTKGVDLLMISPNEAAPLTQTVTQVYNKGIPVVVIDRNINKPAYTTFIGADNVEIGRKAGKYFKNVLLPHGGKIAEIKGLSGSTPAAEREKGFRQGIAGSGIEIVATADGEWDRAKGQEQAEAMLKAHPEITALYSQNDPMAEGARLAADAAGRPDIKITGIDGLPIPSGGLRAVRDGRLQATYVYPTGGEEAVQAAKNLLIDCKIPARHQKLPTQLVTKDNAEEVYTKLNQR